MKLKTHLLEFLLSKIQQSGSSASEIKSVKSLSGGSINEAFQLQTDASCFFVKTNNAARYPGMFEAEARGLQLLASPQAIRIPNVIEVNSLNEDAFILMEFIEEGSKNKTTWLQLGKNLASLHQNSAKNFGLDNDNYIGSLPQSNEPANQWEDFFATQRIEPQLKMAGSGNYFSSSERRQFDQLLGKVDELVPTEVPALIHGDLWSGNYLIDTHGAPVLIDPAVYYGHREMDIAMMHLFGGFSPEVFETYNEHYPMEPDWKDRIDFHNLYPLLVHVNLFGGGYVSQVKSILRKYS